jgi:hypothetical protein
MAEPKWKSAPVVGGYKNAPAAEEEIPVIEPPTVERPPEQSKVRGILSEAMRGMRLGSFPGAVVGGLAAGAGPLMNLENQLIGEGAYKAGGAVTDLAAKTGMPPEVAGGLGFAANVGIQAIPPIVGGELTKALAAPIMQAAGKRLMQSALKPTIKDLKTGKAATAINTLLEKGINPNEAGIEKLKDQITKLDFEIKTVLAKSPETIRKGDVGKELLNQFNELKRIAGSTDDLSIIQKAWMDFRNAPALAGQTDIPVALAHDIKVGKYAQLSKKYGELGSIQTQAQKALARGLKEEIAKKVPAVVGPLAEQSKLLTTMKVAERRALMEGNKNISGLSLLAPTKTGLIAMLADSYGITKSMAARLLYSGAETIPANAARTAGLLYSIGTNRKQGH